MSFANFTSCLNDGDRRVRILPVCIYSFIFVVGLVFNSLALIVFSRNSESMSHTVVYMTNLAVADLLLVSTLPLRVYYHLGFTSLPQPLCDGLGLVLKANMYGSIFLLACICADRCMAVSFPMSLLVQRVRGKAWWICLVIWALTFGTSLPIYLSDRRHVSDGDCFDSLPHYATQLGVILATLSVGFGIPLVTMLVCSWGLLRTVRRSTVARTGLVDGRKIQRMIATSLLVFLLCFLPYHVTLVLLYLNRDGDPCALATACRCSLMVACLNSVLDPVAYYFTTDTFRRKMDFGAIQKMFCLKGRCPEASLRRGIPCNDETD